MQVARCRNCGVEFLEPQPDDATLERIYSASYFFGTETVDAVERHRALKTATARIYLDLIEPHRHGQSRLLEIGCGTGDFLVEATSRGFDVTGIEISPSSSETATKRLDNGRVICGTLDSVNLPAASFDVIANSDVVEHVRDPAAFAREAFRLLKPGGVMLVVTPSLDSWSRKLLRRWWMEYKTEHLFYFGVRSLSRLLRDAGFSAPDIVPNVKVLSIDYVAGHFARFPVPLVGPLVTGIRWLLPGAVAHRPLRLVASGMTALAAKPA